MYLRLASCSFALRKPKLRPGADKKSYLCTCKGTGRWRAKVRTNFPNCLDFLVLPARALPGRQKVRTFVLQRYGVVLEPVRPPPSDFVSLVPLRPRALHRPPEIALKFKATPMAPGNFVPWYLQKCPCLKAHALFSSERFEAKAAGPPNRPLRAPNICTLVPWHLSTSRLVEWCSYKIYIIM